MRTGEHTAPLVISAALSRLHDAGTIAMPPAGQGPAVVVAILNALSERGFAVVSLPEAVLPDVANVPPQVGDQHLCFLDWMRRQDRVWICCADARVRFGIAFDEDGDLQLMASLGFVEIREPTTIYARLTDAGRALLAAAREAGWKPKP